LLNPKQVTFANTESVTVRRVGCVMVADAVAVQPLLSVTVMVYIPALRPVAVALVSPLGDHE
jgi:hypothetical protein